MKRSMALATVSVAASMLVLTGCPPDDGGGAATTTTTVPSCTTGTVTVLGTGYYGDFAMSADGGWVATNTVLNGTGTFARVNRINTATGANQTVGTDTYSSAPTISGNGQRIFWRKYPAPGSSQPEVLRQWDAATGLVTDLATLTIGGGLIVPDWNDVNTSANGNVTVVSGTSKSLVIDTNTLDVTTIEDPNLRRVAGRPSSDGRFIPIAQGPLGGAPVDAVLYDRTTNTYTPIAASARIELMNADASLVLVSTFTGGTPSGFKLWHRSTGTFDDIGFPDGSNPIAMSDDATRFVVRQGLVRYLDRPNSIDFFVPEMGGSGAGVSADLRRIVGHVDGNDMRLFSCNGS